MNQKDIQNIRSEYLSASLSEKDTNSDPIKQFEKWFNGGTQGRSAGTNCDDTGHCYILTAGHLQGLF